MPGRWGPKGRWEEHLIFSLMLETEEAVVWVWGEWGVNHMGSGQRLPWKRLRGLRRAPRPCRCSGLNGGTPKTCPHPNSWTLFLMGVFGVIKNLETRSSWIIQVNPKSSNKCPYETEKMGLWPQRQSL